ncbi:hypothetical protein CHUAL_002533 [Chamberlinius hualienensis]
MAKVHRLSVYRPRHSVKSVKYGIYDETDDLNRDYGVHSGRENRLFNSMSSVSNISNCSRNVVDFLQRREHGAHVVRPISFKKEYGTRHIIQHNLLREVEIPLNSHNKVFCAKWLTDTQIALGTKCNKLLILDLPTKKCIKIPSLKTNRKTAPPDATGGIYSIEINPSQSLLVTGARNANDVAVYQLPTFEPVCVGEDAHNDRIFDITWLDDQYFISGSRDTKVALWKVDESMVTASQHKDSPGHASITPVITSICKNAEKVRAIAFNQKHQELAALSLNAFLHVWDLQTFQQKLSYKLHNCLENVCLALRSDCSLYAVGSKSHLTLHDSRSLCTVEKVPTKAPACSIRSLSFDKTIITMGLGTGAVMFYDCRAGKYMESQMCSWSTMERSGDYIFSRPPPTVLQASRGWLFPDENFGNFFHVDYRPAILTHCYDPSGTRLFTAGGPLPSGLCGNYAALWQ